MSPFDDNKLVPNSNGGFFSSLVHRLPQILPSQPFSTVFKPIINIDWLNIEDPDTVQPHYAPMIPDPHQADELSYSKPQNQNYFDDMILP